MQYLQYLSSPRLALQWDTLGFTRAKLPICAAFCLRFRNSHNLPHHFRISELGNQIQIFDTFERVTLTNYSHWDSCLRWLMGVKNPQMFIQTKTSPTLKIIARWGYLPIGMVLRSERSLKSKMLSLARTSKYVNDTSVLSIKKSEDDS